MAASKLEALREAIRTKLDAVVADAAGKVVDTAVPTPTPPTETKLTSLWTIASGVISKLVVEVEQQDVTPDVPGADKKTLVLETLAKFYDDVIAPLDIPYVPGIVEKTVVDPALRKVFLELASGTIDVLVSIYNKVGFVPA